MTTWPFGKNDLQAGTQNDQVVRVPNGQPWQRSGSQPKEKWQLLLFHDSYSFIEGQLALPTRQCKGSALFYIYLVCLNPARLDQGNDQALCLWSSQPQI